MKLLVLLGLVAGCASSSAPATTTTTTPTAPPSVATIEGPPVRGVEFPASAGTGDPREVKVLVDEPALKLVTIVLRRGTALPEHHAQVPVTIQALQGVGTVDAGGEKLRIDPTHAVVLAAKVPHAVTPEAGADLVLLVHHHGRADERHAH
jgi:quercetin dioxygenase-like cupin family protein